MYIVSLVIILNRIPKDQNVAEKWNVALGVDVNRTVHANVCFQHFEEIDFKRKDKSRLKPNAVPKIFEQEQAMEAENAENNNVMRIIGINESSASYNYAELIPSGANETVETNSCGNTTISSNTQEIQTSAVAAVEKNERLQCKSCNIKDEVINEKENQIRYLRKSLRKFKRKVWNLEKIKLKLNSTLSEMTKKQLLNADLYEALEV